MFVLNACCDDYEDIEQITKQVNELCPQCGLDVAREDILQALRELIELGYVRAWNLAEQQVRKPPRDYVGMPSLEEITALDPYFITRDNLPFREILSTDLFDDTGTLSAQWIGLEAAMTRAEFVQWFVLNSVRRHYLTIGNLEKRTDALAKQAGISISRNEIIQALSELVELRSVRAKNFAELEDPPEYDSMPPLEDIRPYCAYFMETPEGLEVRRHGPPWWPFEDRDDDELRVREGWVPPSE
jgi:hypothetical protein